MFLWTKKKREVLTKISVMILCFILIFYAVISILKGKTSYSNYWGGQVFAPFAILFAVILVYVVFFRWDKLNKKDKEKGPRNQYPWQNYKKW